MELVGRRTEFEHLVERIGQRRLVTVIGPGGIGKTTLARAVAERCGPTFALGALTVDLTTTRSSEEVEHALAGQLGFPSFPALLEAPVDRSALLVIDNCEHVVDAAACAVGAILERCELPTILATSRSPLDLPEEALVVLGPLALPLPGMADPDAPSVRMFVERALDAGTTIDDGQLQTVGELVRRLDGVPLAIDLAAARTRSMGVEEMLTRFDDHLGLLHRPRFRGPARHRGLRSTIAWSHELLEDGDAAFFDRLGVLAGPFDAALAHRVAGLPDEDATASRRRLDTLVDASLLAVEPFGDTTWYRMLIAVRALAVERLTESGQLDATWERLVDHAVAEASTIIGEARHSWPAGLLLRLLLGYENLAAATRRCLERPDATTEDGTRALLLVTAMWGVVHQQHTAEIEDLGSAVLERWGPSTSPWWAVAAATVATARYVLGRLDDAEALIDEAMTHCVDDQPGPDNAAVVLRRIAGGVHQATGRTDEALALFADAAARGRAAGLHALAMESEVFHALLLAATGEVERALRIVEAVAVESEAAGSDISRVWARLADGYIRIRVSPAEARPLIEASLEECRALGYPAGVAANLQSLTVATVLAGDLDAAADAALELIEHAVRRGALDDRYASLQVTAAVLTATAATADPGSADRYRGVAADLVATLRAFPLVNLLSRVDDLVDLAVGEGTRRSLRDAVVLARDTLRTLTAPAPPPAEAGTAPETAPVSAPAARFARVGELWEVDYDGRSALVRATKGMEDLARLLAEPEREIHCLDLMGAGVVQADMGEVLDAESRRAYEQRIRELQAEVEDAESDNDTARAERATLELDALVEHLTAALGLGGAPRTGSGSAERARSAVTQRIRAAIRRIDDALPALGRHLSAAVTTGAYCSYRPERPTAWDTEPRPAPDAPP